MKVDVEQAVSGSLGSSLRRLLNSIDLPETAGKRILVKPNMGRIAPPLSGIVTTKEVIMETVLFFIEQGASEVLLGDSPITGVSSVEAFASAGITPRDMPPGSELIDMDSCGYTDIEVSSGKLISSLRVCTPAAEADCIVSVPVMKTHMHTVVSLGLKNMKGCLYRKEKIKFHKLDGSGLEEKALDTALADMAGVLLPDVTIIDGTVGMEGFGPSSGETVFPGLLIGSSDCIAADAVCAKLMGFDPREVPSLRLCAERGFGMIDTDEMEIIPGHYMDHAAVFTPAPCSIDVEYDGVYVYDSGACSACLSTVVLFLERYKDELADLFDNEDIHIYIGDRNDVQAGENNILIGRCTAGDKDKGIFIQGCPPVASAIIEQLRSQKS